MANSGSGFELRSEPVGQESPWPRRAPFALAPTHDVDRVRKTYQYITHLRTRDGWRGFSTLFTGENPYWNFERIIGLERSLGIRSTFYFLEESRRLATSPPREWMLAMGKYQFSESPVTEVIRRLDRLGWEVGLHGSYDSYRNHDLLMREKRALEDVVGHPVVGIRQHYLNLEIPRTWELHRNAGFRYDSSLGHRDRVGLETLPKFPVAPLGDDFLVLPLAIMDGALFSVCRAEAQARTRIVEIYDAAAREHALVVMLWHQRFVNPEEFPREYGVYAFALAEAARRGAWIAPARDVAEWWRTRGLGSS
ncbi:MAG TPA: polysaccharide deacetylase family protein [Thermoplasmata archaeon]|nr:polysaccharide deacetylase family protein [Thermoplasmata archaeon]